MLPADYERDESERPGEASYLWVLWSGSPPTRARMIALFREFVAASGASGG